LKLRDYQLEACDAIEAAFHGGTNAALMVLATGLGKTIIMAEVTKRRAKHGRCMFAAHRRELLDQAADKFRRVCSISPEVERGELWAQESHLFRKCPIVVTSVQTQISGRRGAKRMMRFDPREFGLLIVDEAHHAPAKSWKSMVEYYSRNPDICILGGTATPDRADQAALGQVFGAVPYTMDIEDGINAGWLVPITQQHVIVTGLDFSQIRTTAGDLNGGDLARELTYERPLHGMASSVIQVCGDRRTLIFAASVAHANRTAEILNRHTPGSAFVIHGKTPDEDRAELMRRYRAGELQYMVNVGIATEGFDVPGIECVVMGRPTKSRSLYAQMLGRGTRPLDGIVDVPSDADGRMAAIQESAKKDLLVLDFVGNFGRHKLVCAADILGGKYPDETRELATQQSREDGEAIDIQKRLEAAERLRLKREIERREKAEAHRRRQIKAKSRYTVRTVDPFNYFNGTPARSSRTVADSPATDKQIQALMRFNVKIPAGLGKKQASAILAKCNRSRNEGPCSRAQANVLRKFGYDPSQINFGRAHEILSAIAQNGWRKVGV